MALHDFNVALLDNQASYVRRDDLNGRDDLPVSSVARTVELDLLVEADASLDTVLGRMAAHGELFVLEQGTVAGIITLADLGRPSVSMYVLATILSIEAAIDHWLIHSTECWWERLSADSLSRVLDVARVRRRQDSELGVVACMMLEHRLALVKKLKTLRGSFKEALGASTKELEQWVERTKRLRDTLAHGSSVLDAPSPGAEASTPAEIIGFILQLQTVARRAWEAAYTTPLATTEALALFGVVPGHADEAKALVVATPERALRCIDLQLCGDHETFESTMTPRFDYDWLPADVHELGVEFDSMLDGPFMEFPLGRLAAVEERMRRHGYHMVRADDLLTAAEGYIQIPERTSRD